MNQQRATKRYSPLAQLILARLREFIREPEAVFWVYGFPLIMVVALGIAFRNKPVEKFNVDIQRGPFADAILQTLNKTEKYRAKVYDADTTRLRLRTGKTDVVVGALKADGSFASPSAGPVYEYLFDPARPESVLARVKLDDTLQRAQGREDKIEVREREMIEPGSRYVDFLIPGLLGMSLMSGGLWGIGFVTVDMRIRKLLKRFLATPMKKTHFLGALMLSRLSGLVPEVFLLLVFARFAFGVVIQGNIFAIVVLTLLGAFTFAGLGLLIASRAKTLEAVSGLMNLTMLPMWVLSGVFFSSERFPEATQPFIKALPLTPLNDALRAVMLEGAAMTSLVPQLAILFAWGAGTFLVALRIFRWY